MRDNKNYHPILREAFNPLKDLRRWGVAQVCQVANIPNGVVGLERGSIPKRECLQWICKGRCFGKDNDRECKFDHSNNRVVDDDASLVARQLVSGIKELSLNPDRHGLALANQKQ